MQGLNDYINRKLDVNLFNDKMELNHFTKKQIDSLFIDDLITENNRPTFRLLKMVKELRERYKKDEQNDFNR